MLNPYAVMYDHKADIYRWSEVADGYVTKSVKNLVKSNVPCRYSAGGQTARGTQDPSLISSHTLFFGRDADIKEGDDVEIQLTDGSKMYLRIGEITPYTYQYQCNAERSEHA